MEKRDQTEEGKNIDQSTEEKHGKNRIVGGKGERTWCYLKQCESIITISKLEIFLT